MSGRRIRRARRKAKGQRNEGGDGNEGERTAVVENSRGTRRRLNVTGTIGTGRRGKPMPIGIKEWIESTTNKGLAGVAREFGTFRGYMPDNMSADAFNSHPGKNRYRDVLCIDSSRVKLNRGDDYIHASYVNGSEGRKEFICCQGPLDATITDFWHMVWQEQVVTIVMLCGVSEGGKIKCNQYWPSASMESVKYDEYEIKNIDSRIEKLGSRGQCHVTQLVMMTDDGGRRPIQHWQWLDWPDRGVPSNVRSLLHLRQKVKKQALPIVIHCSAGIGRTGTLAVLDVCLGQMTKEQECDVAAALRQVRDQRMHSVQNELQYILIHRALIDYATGKWHMGHTPELEKFNQDYKEMVERRPAPAQSPAVT